MRKSQDYFVVARRWLVINVVDGKKAPNQKEQKLIHTRNEK
jgi:hypothetical protein